MNLIAVDYCCWPDVRSSKLSWTLFVKSIPVSTRTLVLASNFSFLNSSRQGGIMYVMLLCNDNIESNASNCLRANNLLLNKNHHASSSYLLYWSSIGTIAFAFWKRSFPPPQQAPWMLASPAPPTPAIIQHGSSKIHKHRFLTSASPGSVICGTLMWARSSPILLLWGSSTHCPDTEHTKFDADTLTLVLVIQEELCGRVKDLVRIATTYRSHRASSRSRSSSRYGTIRIDGSKVRWNRLSLITLNELLHTARVTRTPLYLREVSL